ncbi:BREX-1 system adenine-specific DNA-methyltransferase PglX [Cognaticolwellia beringensis]|uniref:site-specific DNA-methyltransferase (adenine-specific) n=1 Tax=Cognaticolwellia beringensis TaxID=1967665 RepID=A0A222G6G6_9GAMM|nr:BREX-1 system adenine-specific DNA-methyltransferase PglX [Cognaticolwellia beringensis]ASP47401.1 class I SAM-dependent DNA methyltransferase [Cognaticolwellia beringensis]
MNTKNLKAYAPKARSQFIEAIKKRAAQLGIYQDKIADVQFEGGAAIIEGRAFTKKQGDQRKALERKIDEKPLATHIERYDLFIREMAYTWFNRLAAIRYMELHDYLDHGFRVLSNPNGADSLPEILDHASDVVDSLDPDQKYLDKNHIIELQLAGNKEEELYRELLLGQCHRLYNIMPFMFEAIDDATELLLPDNLTKTDSILKGLVNEIPEEDWSEIEVIGWLYQFYISEHKDAVIGKVVKSEDIPAATQLFTPNWIVKYLVQNSLGRQWLATYPESDLKGKMEYYIEPAEQSDDVIEQLKAITPTSIDPEQIKVLDPAAGSGHILVEVYEVLREIYLERGYRLREIPELILTKNIYGLDIDDRAAQLAGFALMMKAREDDRRIFQRVEDGEVALNVYSLQSTEGLDIGKLWQALNLEGNQKQGSTGGLFDTLDGETGTFVQPTGIYKEYFELLQILKTSFLQAKTLGSLIQIDNQHLQNLVALKELLQAKEKGSDPSSKNAAIDLLPIIHQAMLLSQEYDVVVANPPYMGSKYQTSEVKKYLKDHFDGYEKDLFSAFIVRNLRLAKYRGELGFMTPFVWMFISTYEQLRNKLVNDEIISTLIQLEYSGFDGATVPICTFTLTKGHVDDYVGSYIKLSDFRGAGNQSPRTLEAINNRDCNWFFNAKPDDFKKVPSSPIAYWMTNSMRELFVKFPAISQSVNVTGGMTTADNDRFLRLWHEVSVGKSNLSSNNRVDAQESKKKWFPYNKGGSYRKWFGNRDYFVNWYNDGEEIIGTGRAFPRSKNHYFKESLTYTATSSSYFGIRYSDPGFIFDAKGSSCFADEDTLKCSLGFLASKISSYLLQSLNPTIEFQTGNLAILPFIEVSSLKEIVDELIEISRVDWNAYETSWSFSQHSFLESKVFSDTIQHTFCKVVEEWGKLINKTSTLEEKNNSLLIEAYGLNDEVTPNIPDTEITLVCNPKYRYDSKSSVTELENRQQSDTITELISYSVGCMMGRYSLDCEGLVYAQSGNEGFKELDSEGVYRTFPADDDGIVPLASENWLFEDDATARFKEFVKNVWGDEHLQENLEFVAGSLCLHALKPVKGESANDTVRRYFSKQFYKDHCKTYKKRPIYWLFSSGKEKAFECLVYLHRYNEGTLSRMRTEYVTPLMGKYESQHSLLAEQKIEATTTESRRIEKELKSLDKKQAELRTFDEQLKHYAEKRITLDLDDGVKANYGKFGNLLADVKTIHGQAVK